MARATQVYATAGKKLAQGPNHPLLLRSFGANPLFRLQRNIGNQATARLFQGGFLQAKLQVSQPGDADEQAADRVADQVVRAREPGMFARFIRRRAVPRLSRKCSCGGRCDSCKAAEEEELRIQRAGSGNSGFTAPASMHEALRSFSTPLDGATRAYMEPRFGRDFSAVRVHSTSSAAQSARELNALASTVGPHIVFAPGRFAPQTQEGRHLLAHELTHVIQQEESNTAVVHRSPDQLSECTLCSKPTLQPLGPSFTSANVSAVGLDDHDPLYFGPTPVICNNCHQKAQQEKFPTHKLPSRHRVLAWELFNWAVDQVIELIVGYEGKNTVFSLLQSRNDKALHAKWDSYLDGVIATVASAQVDKAPVFSGSDSARSRFAAYLVNNYKGLIDTLDHKAVNMLVQEIKATLLSGHVSRGATLVTDPKIFQKAESREQGRVRLDDPTATATVGFEWNGKRLVAVTPAALYFEVTGHEGIYFEISPSDFRATQPYVGGIATEVTKGTALLRTVGNFIKGFLDALASPVIALADTAAKIIDMSTMAVAAGVKGLTGRQIRYTCLSSTCRNYSSCVKDAEESNKSTEHCKSEADKEAVEQATIVVPLYRQGRECLNGNAEACGSIAALSVGLVEEGLGKLETREFKGVAAGGAARRAPIAKAELEESAIREAIGRRRPGDIDIGKALEKPKAHEEIAPPKPAPSKAKPLSPSTLEDIRKFAGQKINPRHLQAEVSALVREAAEPANVRIPAEAKYDAEMTTTEHGETHTYERERYGTKRWCRFSEPPGDCGVPVPGELDSEVDQALRKSAREQLPLREEEAAATVGEPGRTAAGEPEPGRVTSEPRLAELPQAPVSEPIRQLQESTERLSNEAKAAEPKLQELKRRIGAADREIEKLENEVTGKKAYTKEAVEKHPQMQQEYSRVQQLRKRLREAKKERARIR